MSPTISCAACGAANLPDARLCCHCGSGFAIGGTLSGGQTLSGGMTQGTGRTPFPAGTGRTPPLPGQAGQTSPTWGTMPTQATPPTPGVTPGLPGQHTMSSAQTQLPQPGGSWELFKPGVVIEEKYELIEQLGRGGMGIVYRARHRMLGDEVAIKFMDPGLSNNASVRQRFFREARVLRSFRHRGAVSVHDAGEIRGTGVMYMVMDLAPGESLSDYLKREGPMAPELAVELGGQILDVLVAAHAKGIVHRDIKPKNVHIAPGEHGPRVWVLDFGIAKLLATAAQEGDVQISQPGMVIGTPEYMSPEQAAGDEIDARSDLFSTAAMLYRMLSGQLPHRATTRLRMIHAILTKEAAPLEGFRPELPGFLTAAIKRGLCKDPAQRWQTAADFARALRGKEPPMPALPPPVAAVPRVSEAERTMFASSEPLRPPATKAAGSRIGVWLLLLVLIVGAGAAGWHFREQIARLVLGASPVPGGIALELRAPADGAVVGAEITLQAVSDARQLLVHDRLSGRSWGMEPEEGGFALTLSLPEDGARWLVFEASAVARRRSESLHVTVDTVLPQISLFAPFDGQQSEDDQVVLDGRVDDPHLRQVTINGQTVDAVFQQSFPLVLGENSFRIEAVDAAGNHDARLVTVVRLGAGVEPAPAPLQYELVLPSVSAEPVVRLQLRSSDPRLQAVEFLGRSFSWQPGGMSLDWPLQAGSNSRTLRLYAEGLEPTERVVSCNYELIPVVPAAPARFLSMRIDAAPDGFYLSSDVDDTAIEITWGGTKTHMQGTFFEQEIWPRNEPSWLTVRLGVDQLAAETSFVVCYQRGLRAWLPDGQANALDRRGAAVRAASGADVSTLIDGNPLDGVALRAPFSLELELPESAELLGLRLDSSTPWSGSSRPAVAEIYDADSGERLAVLLFEDAELQGASLPSGVRGRRLRLDVLAGQRPGDPIWLGELAVLVPASAGPGIGERPGPEPLGRPLPPGPLRDVVELYELETYPRVSQVSERLYEDSRLQIPEDWGQNLLEGAEVVSYSGGQDAEALLCDGNLLTHWSSPRTPSVWTIKPVFPVHLERIALIKGLLPRSRGASELFLLGRAPDSKEYLPLAEMRSGIDRQVVAFSLPRDFRAAELLLIARTVHDGKPLQLAEVQAFGSVIPEEPMGAVRGTPVQGIDQDFLSVEAIRSNLRDPRLLRLVRRDNEDELLMPQADAPVAFLLRLEELGTVAGCGFSLLMRRRQNFTAEIEVYARVEGQEEWELQVDLSTDRQGGVRFRKPVRTDRLLIVFRRFSQPLRLRQLGVFGD